MTKKITCNATTASILTNYMAAHTAVEKKKGEFENQLFDKGLRSIHFVSPKNGGGFDQASWDAMITGLINGLPDDDKRLFLVDVKALSPEDKDRKRKIRQGNIGGRITDLGKAMLRREIDAGEIEPEQKESKSDSEKIIAALKTIANTARKDETPEYDPAQLIKSVAHTMSLIGSDDDLRSIIEG